MARKGKHSWKEKNPPLSEERKMAVREKLRKQKLLSARNGGFLILGSIIVFFAVRFIFFTIHDPVVVNGYAHGEHFVRMGRGKALVVSYSYQYKGKMYISEKTFLMTNDFKMGDSLYITISASSPQTHEITGRFYNDILNIEY